jgi:tRNA(fMet)-specific endonuclease VapC
MKYLLDTNTCIYVINKKPAAAVRKIRSQRPDEVGISTITIAELEYGVARSGHPDQNRVALMEFLLPFAVLDFDQSASSHYGQIRASLESAGTPIGPMDLLLAAQARSRSLVLVTNNEKEFKRVEGLRIENWVR